MALHAITKTDSETANKQNNKTDKQRKKNIIKHDFIIIQQETE